MRKLTGTLGKPTSVTIVWILLVVSMAGFSPQVQNAGAASCDKWTEGEYPDSHSEVDLPDHPDTWADENGARATSEEGWGSQRAEIWVGVAGMYNDSFANFVDVTGQVNAYTSVLNDGVGVVEIRVGAWEIEDNEVTNSHLEVIASRSTGGEGKQGGEETFTFPISPYKTYFFFLNAEATAFHSDDDLARSMADPIWFNELEVCGNANWNWDVLVM